MKACQSILGSFESASGSSLINFVGEYKTHPPVELPWRPCFATAHPASALSMAILIIQGRHRGTRAKDHEVRKSQLRIVTYSLYTLHT